MKIGLFGGSFDPAHEGHAHVAETALKRLGLNRVWWLVSPQNPLKAKSSPFETRLASAQTQARGARMLVTDFEQRFGCAYTYQTIRKLKQLYPGVKFTLIMGADNLANFRKWRKWKEVAESVPIVVVSRPGAEPRHRMAAPEGWRHLNARHNPQSSTTLRARSASAPRAAGAPKLAKPPRK